MLKFQNNNITVPASFEDFFLTTYVIVDELYHRFAPTKVINRRHVLDVKLSDPEIITISFCGELVGVDSENAWFSFVKKNYRHLFPQICSRSWFNRTRQALMQTTELLRQKLISSFPVPPCSAFVSFLFRLLYKLKYIPEQTDSDHLRICHLSLLYIQKLQCYPLYIFWQPSKDRWSAFP